MKNYQYILTLLIIAFGSSTLYAQHLFSVHYDDLSQDHANLIRTEIARFDAPVSTKSMTRNNENKEVYAFSLSSVQNTRIVILNEETGNSVVITPVEGAPAQFELAPFFIEELRQAALGEADRYLVVETGADFSVRNSASVSAASREVFIPRYLYGPKENVKEALPKDRQIVHIFKEKPRLIPAFPDDPEHLRLLAELEEEMSYYVYMYKLPDGTLIIYDEHFNPSEKENTVSTDTRTSTCCTSFGFLLSGLVDNQQIQATIKALDIWSAELGIEIPIEINVTFKSISGLGGSFRQPHYWNPVTQTWYSSALGNQLAGYNVAPGIRDIRIEMNSNVSWYYGITGNPSSSQYDWITVMLHEITHGLGFSTLIGMDGDGGYAYTINDGTPNGTGNTPTNYPGIFDRQLYLGATGNICLTDLTKAQRKTLITSGNLFAGRPGSYLLAANGGSRVKMYAPSDWVSGSSVSHWDTSVTFTTFMKYNIAKGFRCIAINAREIAIMRDMGWEIPCPTMVNFTDRIVTVNRTVKSCGDINVQTVTVQNNAKLVLDAVGKTTINGPFQVKLGSSLQVK